jgi:hypothetical protein
MYESSCEVSAHDMTVVQQEAIHSYLRLSMASLFYLLIWQCHVLQVATPAPEAELSTTA